MSDLSVLLVQSQMVICIFVNIFTSCRNFGSSGWVKSRESFFNTGKKRYSNRLMQWNNVSINNIITFACIPRFKYGKMYFGMLPLLHIRMCATVMLLLLFGPWRNYRALYIFLFLIINLVVLWSTTRLKVFNIIT